MTNFYWEHDAHLTHLQGCRVAVLGYGNLGRSFALNLRDSGVPVMVGNAPDEYARQARVDGFTTASIGEATRYSNIHLLTIPDEAMPRVFLEEVSPALKTGDLLLFASAYNIAYKFIEPPIFVDVGLLAPRTLGPSVRQAYENGTGYPTYVALHHRATAAPMERLLAVALAVGGLKQGALEVTFQQEVELDLFWQQAILPVLHTILATATQILIQEGYPKEAILSELYLSGELSEFFRQAAEHGLRETLSGMSPMGQYSVLSRTERFQESKISAQMEGILEVIRSGAFAREWASEFADGYPRLNAVKNRLKESLLWRTEQAVLQSKQDMQGSS